MPHRPPKAHRAQATTGPIAGPHGRRQARMAGAGKRPAYQCRARGRQPACVPWVLPAGKAGALPTAGRCTSTIRPRAPSRSNPGSPTRWAAYGVANEPLRLHEPGITAKGERACSSVQASSAPGSSAGVVRREVGRGRPVRECGWRSCGPYLPGGRTRRCDSSRR